MTPDRLGLSVVVERRGETFEAFINGSHAPHAEDADPYRALRKAVDRWIAEHVARPEP